MNATSIFNDVLGPVMTGPSSSHTAGPGRIGWLVGNLLDNITNVSIVFPGGSSYAGVYKGQKSDVAFASGLSGVAIHDRNFKNGFKNAQKKNIAIEFFIEDVEADHPNTAIITVKNAEQEVRIVTLSTGGGTISITDIQNSPVNMTGNTHSIIIFCYNDLLHVQVLSEKVFNAANVVFRCDTATGCIIHYVLQNKPILELLSTLNKELQDVRARACYLAPVFPIVDFFAIQVPFTNGKGLQSYCTQEQCSFAQAAIDYESIRSQWASTKVLAHADYLLTVMEESIKCALEKPASTTGFLKPSAQSMNVAEKQGLMIDAGVIQRASIYATGIMEVNSAMGIVVAGPTAGSCGVLGATLVALHETGNYSRAEIVNALMCAGIAGVFIAEQATFAAEICACQAEIGSASAMTAAAVAYLLDCKPEAILAASSLAMQNLLGLICDPVAGRVEIPCVNRNSVAVANAIVSANMVVGGFDPVIPYDETIQAMFKVGKMLPRELRCTGLGGLCDTPTAKTIFARMKST